MTLSNGTSAGEAGPEAEKHRKNGGEEKTRDVRKEKTRDDT